MEGGEEGPCLRVKEERPPARRRPLFSILRFRVCRALGMRLLQRPREGLFLISEVPLRSGVWGLGFRISVSGFEDSSFRFRGFGFQASRIHVSGLDFGCRELRIRVAGFG